MNGNAQEKAGSAPWFAARLFPIDSHGASGPLTRIVWRHARILPVILVLGLLATLLEGFGISMLIPLVSLMTSAGLPVDAPEPIRYVVELARGMNGGNALIVIGSIIVGLVLIKGLIQVANAALIAKFDTQVGHDVRVTLSRQLLALDYNFYLEHDAARLVKILATDVWYGMETVRANESNPCRPEPRHRRRDRRDVRAGQA